VPEPNVIRVAAAGDIHASDATREHVQSAFADVDGTADLVLLAGDLTQQGQVEEAQIVADAARELPVPVVAILGNHDWHSDRAADVSDVLREAGIVVLERSSTLLQIGGSTVGIVGVKGFVGGFGAQWANFGEPLFRQAYAETTTDVEALAAGLNAISAAAIRIVLLHYAPTAATLAGEPERLWLVLGAERLATPIAEHQPDVVLHGHAHAGSFEGAIGETPVYNVAVQVTGKDFYVFELEVTTGRSAVEVEAP
jgi:Icc-related predicted phosphoesterase